MARFVKGDAAVIPFPFSDLTQNKRRPALVIVDLQGDDLILCQITSQLFRDQYAILIDNCRNPTIDRWRLQLRAA